MTPRLDRAEVERFRTVVAQRFGLHYDDGKLDYLADVLHRRMETTGSLRFDAYAESLISSPRARDELRALAEALTVNETFFFRNADNFRAIAEHVFPERIREKRREKRLRVLSAGCASGEEPYSLAIVLREMLPDLDQWDVKIVGVDLNPAMLVKAAQARYSAWSLRATPEEIQRRYFRPDGRDFILDPRIQAMVTFEERNLVEQDPLLWQPATYDIVFVRNVIMYFTPEMMREVAQRVGQSLLPGGYFFLGHAETLRGLSQEFHLCHTHETFYYQKRRSSDARREPIGDPRQSGDPTAESLPVVLEATASWVEAIQRASDRIAGLVHSPTRVASDAPPTMSAPTSPTVRAWDLGLVLEAMRQERFSDAFALLLALPPDAHHEPDALLLRAVLLTNSGKLAEAEEACAHLLALDELSAGAHYLMALCREHARDSAAALEHDQTAVYLDASFAMPHLHMGLAARRAGDDVTAKRELAHALVLLAREDASRLLLFGGGFSRDTLAALCRTEPRIAGGEG